MFLHEFVCKESPETLTTDDRCFRAWEFVAGVDGEDEAHRIQRLLVWRNGQLWKYDRDIGPASKYPGAIAGLQLVLGVRLGKRVFVEHSVGEALDMLDECRYHQLRGDPLYDLRMTGKRTLAQEFLEQQHEIRQLRARRSVIGPLITIQRN